MQHRNAGPVRQGHMQCQNGTLICVSDWQPQQEMCNGLDDDCDGSVDEDFPELGNPCTGGEGCTGQYLCHPSSTHTVCVY